MRALWMLIDIHRATQYHQPVIALGIELGIRVTLEVLEADAMAAASDQGIQRPKGFGGDVLEYKQAGHGGRKSGKVVTMPNPGAARSIRI